MKIALIVFSGTGNTLYVSKFLAKELQRLGAMVDILTLGIKQKEIQEAQIFREQIAAYDMLGIAFPVLGFGAPTNVLEFARTLPSVKKSLFIFKSAADNHQVNNAASEMLERILTQKGYDVFHDFLYMMPSNFMIGYPKAFNLQMIDAVAKKARMHASEIMNRTRVKLSISKMWHLIAACVHYLESNYGRHYFGQSLNATLECNLCGTCIKNCPIGNIEQEENKVTFHQKCLFCMRCIYHCPTHAIKAKWYNWCIIKEGYNLQEYLDSKDSNRVFITQKSKGFWRHFRDYFYEERCLHVKPK